MDTCTRYPIAIPLVRHAAVDIASSIIYIFSTFGHRTELQARLWREVLRVLKVNHTYATIAHPMTGSQ